MISFLIYYKETMCFHSNSHMFPRQLLCRHFWTEEQQVDYAEYWHSKRWHHAVHIISYLQRHGPKIHDPSLRNLFCDTVQEVSK